MKIKDITRRDIGWLICVLMVLVVGFVIGTNIQLRDYSQQLQRAEAAIVLAQEATEVETV